MNPHHPTEVFFFNVRLLTNNLRAHYGSWGDWTSNKNMISLSAYDPVDDLVTYHRWVKLNNDFDIIETSQISKHGAFYTAITNMIKEMKRSI
jgi:hypothetical protein